jgi:hypothetical protein
MFFSHEEQIKVNMIFFFKFGLQFSSSMYDVF